MNTLKPLSALSLIVIGTLSLSACDTMMGKDSGTAAPAATTSNAATTDSATTPASLYERLGGKPAITAVVDEFVANVAADSRINARFANTNIPEFKAKLIDQICDGTGGPCTYKGEDMKEAHAGMAITEGDFNALVEDLVKALDTFKVPEKEKSELLAILGPMKADIVTA